MAFLSVFADKFQKEVFNQSARPVLLEANIENDEDKYKHEPLPKIESKMACSYCKVEFTNVQQQREHFRLDWHRYNLKQSLQSKPSISEDEFIKKIDNDDVSSISGSDTEEEDSLDTYVTALGKMFFQNKNGQVFSMYRCLLFDKKEEQDKNSVSFFEKFHSKCCTSKQWTVLMLGGGHFAGAVFNESEPILHKTFHSYTVRAGQGASQSSRDGKSGGSHPKSAGASLRRYNEMAFTDHIKSILTAWSKQIEVSSLVIYRASGPFNRSILFGGKEPLLDRNDKRLCTIPFSTGRASFAEVKRVHSLLSQVQLYDSIDAASSLFLKQKSPERRSKTKSSAINRARSREEIQRALPVENSIENDSDQEEQTSDLDTENLEISFEELQEYGDSLTPEQRKIGQKKKRTRKSKTQKLKEKEEARKQKIIDVLVRGDLLSLKEMLAARLNTFDEALISENEICADYVNEILDDNGNTFLHLAALNEHIELVEYLMEKQADPCLKNKNQQTPYACTSKPVREVFKKFAKDNPDKYNYNKAQIPLNALTEEELSERRKTQKKIKREKEKEKKKETIIKQKEQDEKSRFLGLSDREKRALAAERRILNSSGQVTSRCFFCAMDISGKVPFEYSGNRFCSTDCLKAHRLKNMST